MLIRIEAPHFVAAIVLGKDRRIVEAAPIVGYMIGWTPERVREYVDKRGWTAERV